MATWDYGSTTNHWRCYMQGYMNTSETTCTFYYAAGFQSQSWGFSLSSGVTTTLSVGSTSRTGSGGISYAGSGTTAVYQIINNDGVSFSRGHSAYNVTVSATTTNSSGYMNGTSSCSRTYTIPAKSSYAVKYDANGGSGAPSSQTKWYGETLTLSSTVPTRSLYTFKGWATSSNATSANYAAGGSYTGNAAITLYAVWKLAYTVPKIGNVQAYRCNSSGTADDSGTYARVTWNYSTFSSAFPATTSSATIGSTTKSGTTGGYNTTSNSAIFSSIALESTYTVTIKVADSQGSATATATIPTQFFYLDFSPEGGVGIGCVAPAEKAVKSAIRRDDVYPVGAVYISYVSTSPASLFGGSWTQITGRFLRMANDVSTGGANTHTHGLNSGFAKIGATDSDPNSISYVASSTSNMGSATAYTIIGSSYTSSSRAFNHWTPLAGNSNSGSSMPAYQDLYAWRRTA